LIEELHVHLEPLPAKARALALAFHTAALEASVKQGMKLRGLSEVALFIPVEAVATSLDIDRVTIWRWFERYPILRTIIAKREHYGSVTSYTTGELMTWKTGTVWLVRLKPKLEREARVRFEHLKHSWRDLEEDIKRGHTVRSQLEQGCNHHKNLEELVTALRKEILKWTLTPAYIRSPLSDRCIPQRVPRHELVGAVLDLEGAPKAKRGEVVDRAARTVAAALGDGHLDVWRWVMWQMLRLDYQGESYFTAVLNVLTRAMADREEDFARCAGALAISRLKASGIWQRLKEAPPLRVGVAPVKA
jgi:hypothetical protein